MPSIAREQKDFYKSKIRSLIAVDHGISRLEIHKRLDTQGLHLDRHYVGKLYDEILTERAHRMDRRLLNQALSSFEDTMTELVRIAWEIASSPWQDPKARVMALKEIREAHNAVFEKLFDAGVFDRKRGSIDLMIRNTPLSDEKKKSIRDAFENWGLLPAEAATAEAPKEDESTANRTTEATD